MQPLLGRRELLVKTCIEDRNKLKA